MVPVAPLQDEDIAWVKTYGSNAQFIVCFIHCPELAAAIRKDIIDCIDEAAEKLCPRFEPSLRAAEDTLVCATDPIGDSSVCEGLRATSISSG
jgi:hypothetical protein